MEVIIYSFFIVIIIAAVTYVSVKKRFSRLLQEEQEKSFSLRNSELHLAAEKQRLESALLEKERHIGEIQSHISTESSKTFSLSSEVINKEKQIQSLSAQLQLETTLRESLEKELSDVNHRLSELSTRHSTEEQRATHLSTDLSTKDAQIQTLSAELQHTNEQRTSAEEKLSEQQHTVTLLNQQSMDLQQTNLALQQEIAQLKSSEEEYRQTVQTLQEQAERLNREMNALRELNESAQKSRDVLAEEFHTKEQRYLQKITEAELYLSATKQDLEKTAELLQEQTSIREATEHALQESKQKLYALIGELEQKIKEQANAIAALQDELKEKSDDHNAAVESIHHILRRIPIPVFVVNELGLCEYCNPPLEELVGYGMTELSAKHFSRLFPEEDRAFYEEQWNNAENRSEQFQGETRVIAATNDAISASLSFVEIHPSGDMKKYLGCILDRTSEKDSKEYYAAAKEREQELLDLKSRFIGMVSNQLRTSLVTIATNTELLERFLDKWSDERRYHSFLRINDSIRQMIELVRDVTFTTRATTESYTLAISPVNLEEVFQSTAKELMADLESHHRFVLSVQGNTTAIPLDEKLIKTIAYQLLSNALKYSRDSTEVSVHLNHNNSVCGFTVADQGIGIPAAEQKHLFSSFFRASNVSNIYGTGLGLTIVQQCVQMHGGTIAIESTLHKGTTVSVSLPIR